MTIAYKLGGAARAIWNGPFYIGKLTQPASVGDVLLKILETIWRAIVSVLAFLGVMGVIAGAWVQIIEQIFFPPLKKQLDITVIYDVEGSTPPPIYIGKPDKKPKRCSADYPLKVAIINRSSETVREVAFDLEVRRPGFSKDLSTASAHESDAILKPGYSYTACWSLPSMDEAQPNPTALEYKADVLWVTCPHRVDRLVC